MLTVPYFLQCLIVINTFTTVLKVSMSTESSQERISCTNYILCNHILQLMAPKPYIGSWWHDKTYYKVLIYGFTMYEITR